MFCTCTVADCRVSLPLWEGQQRQRLQSPTHKGGIWSGLGWGCSIKVHKVQKDDLYNQIWATFWASNATTGREHTVLLWFGSKAQFR